jgi:hypothetical protein
MKTGLILVLVLALAGAIAAGLLDLWPDLRSKSDPTAERSEKVRVLRAVQGYMTGWEITGVRLDFLPHQALVHMRTSAFDECVLAAQDYGDHFDAGDLGDIVPCNL